MAARNYDEALRRLLVHEGGYTNHPADPGGPTNFGITIHDYRRYIKANATADDVRAMKLAEARAIYRAKYWGAMRCDNLPDGVDYAVFDYGVNSGIGRAGKVLRRVLKLSDNTSAVTDDVIKAARLKDPSDVCEAICDERIAFLKGLKTWPVFGAGWGRRVAEVRRASVAMARKVQPAEVPAIAAPGRAAIQIPATAIKSTQASGGAATAVAGVGFWDWIAAHPLETAAMVAAALALAALAVHLLRRHFRNRQEGAPQGWTPPIVLDVAPQPAA